MKLDGKQIAQEILENLKPQVENLKNRGVVPTLAIILVGDDKASQSYIKQKELKAAEIGAQIKFFHFDTTSQEDLLNLIDKLNRNNDVHGIIVQRPLPKDFDRDKISQAIDIKKDVDGFNSASTFDAPVAQAVVKLLHVAGVEEITDKRIAVIGKGETAGGPILRLLKEMGARPEIIDRSTPDPDESIKNAEIIISAVGKEGVLDSELLNQEQILIGVGLYMGEDGKLHGDYKEEDVEGKVKAYTPKLGGVGPVNVAFLMQNLVEASTD